MDPGTSFTPGSVRFPLVNVVLKCMQCNEELLNGVEMPVCFVL